METIENSEEGFDRFLYGSLDTSNIDRRIWLVKVPEYVFEFLNELENNQEIGSVKIYQSKKGELPIVIVHLNNLAKTAPNDHILQFSKCNREIYVFEEDVVGKAVSINGKVEQECSMKPFLNELYREVLKQRNDTFNVAKRAVQMLDSEDMMHVGAIPHLREHDLLIQKRRRVESDDKRERLPKSEITDLLFKAFEKHPRWTFNDLMKHIRQPSAYLKEILREIAIYNKRGPYKNMYELRPEYTQI